MASDVFFASALRFLCFDGRIGCGEALSVCMAKTVLIQCAIVEKSSFDYEFETSADNFTANHARLGHSCNSLLRKDPARNESGS